MKSPNAFICDLFQTCYDYLWDKWGVRIGTFRFVWISPIMLFIISEGFRKASLSFYPMFTIFVSLTFYGFFGLLHLVAQNHFQKGWKNHVLLNEHALKWKNDWARIPIMLTAIFFAFLIGYAAQDFWDKIEITTTFNTLVGYGYAMTVTVRSRKEIKQKEKHSNIAFNPT